MLATLCLVRYSAKFDDTHHEQDRLEGTKAVPLVKKDSGSAGKGLCYINCVSSGDVLLSTAAAKAACARGGLDARALVAEYWREIVVLVPLQTLTMAPVSCGCR